MKNILTVIFVLFCTVYAVAEDYPLNKKTAFSLGTCSADGKCSGIVVTSQVVKRGHQYVYIYRLQNLDKKHGCLFQWELLDRITSGGDKFKFMLDFSLANRENWFL